MAKKRKLTKFELTEWRKYCKMKGQFLKRCKVNELVIYPNNSRAHELGKFNLYFDLRSEGENLLTECYNKEGERCDLVSLSSGERYEIETDPKRAKRFEGRPVNVIMVNKEAKQK